MISENLIGFLCAAGAATCFGSFGVFIKLPAVRKANIDPMVFQIYYSLAIFTSSWLLLLFHDLRWTWLGVLGSVLWVPSSILSIVAINYAGMAISQGVWSGISSKFCATFWPNLLSPGTVLVSFAWGAVAFGEDITSVWGTIGALTLLLVGIGGVSVCNMQWQVRLPHLLRCLYIVVPFLIPFNHGEYKSINDGNKEDQEDEKKRSAREFYMGMAAAVTLGLLNGSKMVPNKLAPPDDQGVVFAISFAIGVIPVTVMMGAVYFGVQLALGQGLPKFHVKVAALPGFCAGLVWTAGNIMSIYATIFLGLTVGYPLSQISLVVGGLWGMIVFKEITRWSAITAFFAFAVVILGGAVLLSLYG